MCIPDGNTHGPLPPTSLEIQNCSNHVFTFKQKALEIWGRNLTSTNGKKLKLNIPNLLIDISHITEEVMVVLLLNESLGHEFLKF